MYMERCVFKMAFFSWNHFSLFHSLFFFASRRSTLQFLQFSGGDFRYFICNLLKRLDKKVLVWNILIFINLLRRGLCEDRLS